MLVCASAAIKKQQLKQVVMALGGGLNNRNLLSHNTGGQKSQIKMSIALVPFEGCKRKNLFQNSLLTCRQSSSPYASSCCLLFIRVQVQMSPSQTVKNPPAVRETWVRSLGWEDPLEKGKATHSQYSGLEKSMGSQRIGHNRATFTFTSITENRCKIKRTPPTHTHTHTHTHY